MFQPAIEPRPQLASDKGKTTSMSARNAQHEHLQALRRHVERNMPSDFAQEFMASPWAFVGMAVVADPPEGEEEFTDERYWVKLVLPKYSVQTDEVLEVEADPTIAEAGQVFMATNMAEMTAHSHGLTASDTLPFAMYRAILSKKTPSILYAFASWESRVVVLPAAGDQWTVLTAVTAGVWGVDLVHAAEDAPVP